MATESEMEWYKSFYVGPDFDLKDNMCVPLFRDLYECQEKAAFPLRDCVLFKEDFLECVIKTKQVMKRCSKSISSVNPFLLLFRRPNLQ